MNANIKPNYLVHWTGKDFCTDLSNITNENRVLYIERLESTLNEGLWMNKCEDIFHSFGDNPILKITHDYITCFTELKISMSYKHVQRYGLMGFGFNFDYILKLNGAPVHYMQCGQNDINLMIFKDLLIYLGNNVETNVEFYKHFNQMKILAGLIKPMYDDANIKLLNNMEESEWRIIYNTGIDELLFKTNKDLPKYKIPFSQNDLKLLVLPDNKTKEMMYNSSYIHDWIKTGKYMVTILTYEDILSY